MEFSHQTRDLECFADWYSLPKKQMSQFRSFGKLIYIYIYIVLARYNFSSRLWSWLTKEIAGAFLYSGTLSSTRFSVYFSNHSGRSRNGFPRTLSLSSFLFGFWISAGPRDGSPRTLSMPRVFSLLFHAGCCVGTMGSCGTNVGEVSEDEVEELVDRPGTTKGT